MTPIGTIDEVVMSGNVPPAPPEPIQLIRQTMDTVARYRLLGWPALECS
jgi:hypothetical protein